MQYCVNLFNCTSIKNRQQIAGYTLLELLLVITILAILAGLGINLYYQNTQSIKITKISSQMQTILQAAVAYYNDNGCWPYDAAHLCTASNMKNNCPNASPLPFSVYLPVGNNNNPWDGKIC